MAADESEGEDGRIDYIGIMTKACTDISNEMWGDFLWKEENKIFLKEFLDSPATMLLLIYVDHRKKICATTEFLPVPRLPKISIYFIKYESIAIPLTGYKKTLLVGNLYNFPLKQYQAVFEEVMVPILCNPQNSVLWPPEVTEDVTMHIQDFRKVLYHTLGLAEGKTLLPVPELAKTVDLINIKKLSSSSLSDPQIRSIMYAIETMIVDWTHLINEVLESNSEQYLISGPNLGPLSEITFWNERKENLEFIYAQMKDPVIEKIAIALEKVDNCYLPAYKSLFRNVAAALTEANDITVNLETLGDHVKTLEDCDFPQLIGKMHDSLFIITQAWAGSQYFSSTPSRICVMVQKICNLLIKKTCNFIKPAELFTMDRDVIEGKVDLALRTLNRFVEVYNECRENMESSFQYSKLYPWEFPDERVFCQLRKFLQRLKDIHEIFEAAELFYELPKVILQGAQQYSLKTEISRIFEEFCSTYAIFTKSKFDFLDFERMKFEVYKENFWKEIYHLEEILGAIVGQESLACATTEESFKLIQMFEFILKYPKVNSEFKYCLPGLASKVNAQIRTVKQMYEDQMESFSKHGNFIVCKNMPPVSGAVMWASDLQNKISLPINALKEMNKYIPASKDILILYDIHSEVSELLSKFEENVFSTWTNLVNANVDKYIQESILVKGSGDSFQLNFNPLLTEVIEEVRCFLKIDHPNIPEMAVNLYNRSDEFYYAHCLLTSSLLQYDGLCLQSSLKEKQLMSNIWKIITDLMEKGLQDTWESTELEWYADELHEAIKVTSQTYKKSNENVEKLKQSIGAWSSKSAFGREEASSLMDFTIYVNDILRDHFQAVVKTGLLAEQMLEENRKMFQCDPHSEEWNSYVRYLDSMIEIGLRKSITCSLDFLIENTDPENEKLEPLIKIEMRLEKEFIFTPPLSPEQGADIEYLIDKATSAVFRMASKIKRFTCKKRDYMEIMTECKQLRGKKNTVLQNVSRSISKVLEAVRALERYSSLWIPSIEEVLEEFLLYGPKADTEEDEDVEDEEEEVDEVFVEEKKTFEMKPPTEEEFRSQISKFVQVYEIIDEMPPLKAVVPWILLDYSQFKEKLLVLLRQWILIYKATFIEHKSLGKLRKLAKFDD